jgi:threonine/homoserine/homoserine lactone efflux protein
MFESILLLIVATALLLGSPGPAPIALAATGATYGIKNGIPFLLGILSGLIVVIIGSAVGIATLFNTFPTVRLTVQVIGALYIFYVAQKIARAPIIISGSNTETKPSFVDGFILNLLNPKASAAFLSLFSQFIIPLESQAMSYVLTALICFAVAVIVDTLWLFLGSFLKPLFEAPKSARILRIIFALLMVIAVVFALAF